MTKPSVMVAVGIIYNAERKILLVKRSPHADMGGLWELPGGKIKPSECPEKALRRELTEELSITPTLVQPYTFAYHEYDHKRVVLLAFEVLSFTGEPTLNVGQTDYQWVDMKNVHVYPMPEATLKIVEIIKKNQILAK